MRNTGPARAQDAERQGGEDAGRPGELRGGKLVGSVEEGLVRRATLATTQS